jgi:hypothetical protein
MHRPIDEKLIIALEDSLRQTYRAQKRLKNERENLKALTIDVTPEEERISQELNALERMAKQTETAIYSLLATLR